MTPEGNTVSGEHGVVEDSGRICEKLRMEEENQNNDIT